jgi:hypothetical protein
MDQAVERVWVEISSEHDEARHHLVLHESRESNSSYRHKVRAYISELLAFASKIKVRKLTHAGT